MLVNGRILADTLYGSLRTVVAARSVPPHLTIITCQPNQATQQYLALKKRNAQEIGISVNIIEVSPTITTAELVTTINKVQSETDGIVVQLPLPDHIDTTAVLAAIPRSHDVDGMHYDGTTNTMMSPVVAAIAHICEQYNIAVSNKHVVVIGEGRLVGKPAAYWAKAHGAEVTVITKDTDPVVTREALASADIIILGAGQAGLLTPDMIREGAIIFDAGTSEDGGELKGDADPACAQKASIMTPVPGGIGPLTVACLLRNLVFKQSLGCA